MADIEVPTPSRDGSEVVVEDRLDGMRCRTVVQHLKPWAPATEHLCELLKSPPWSIEHNTTTTKNKEQIVLNSLL